MEYAVLRYKYDVPLHERVHHHTLGRHSNYEAAEAALSNLPAHVADRLQIEERVEEDGE